MRDHHHRVALGRQLLKQGKNLLTLTAVQRAGRLIGKNYLPAVHQCSGDRHPLLLATGKFGRQVRFATVQPNRPQKTFRLPSALLRWDASVLRRQFDIAQCRHGVQQTVILEHETEGQAPQPRELSIIQLSNVAAGKAVTALGRSIQATHDVQQSGLAGPGGSGEAHELARIDGDGDVLEDANDATVRCEGPPYARKFD